MSSVAAAGQFYSSRARVRETYQHDASAGRAGDFAALQSCMAWSARSVATAAAMAALGMAAAARPIHRIRQARRLEAIIGDFRGFIDALHGHLLSVGIDAPRLGYEMDHICYRVDTKAGYHQVLAAIVPELGTCLIESMIGAAA